MLAPMAIRLTAVRLASWGACRDQDPELFFPIGSAAPALAQVAEAKTVCAGCQVRADCLSYAIATGQDDGVWGGTTEEERRVIKAAAKRRATNPAEPVPGECDHWLDCHLIDEEKRYDSAV